MQDFVRCGAIILLTVLVMGCERTKSVDGAQEHNRSVIIAGVPVHEADYRLSQPETAFNEPIAQEDRR